MDNVVPVGQPDGDSPAGSRPRSGEPRTHGAVDQPRHTRGALFWPMRRGGRQHGWSLSPQQSTASQPWKGGITAKPSVVFFAGARRGLWLLHQAQRLGDGRAEAPDRASRARSARDWSARPTPPPAELHAGTRVPNSATTRELNRGQNLRGGPTRPAGARHRRWRKDRSTGDDASSFWVCEVRLLKPSGVAHVEGPVEGPPELQGPLPRHELVGVRPGSGAAGRPDSAKWAPAQARATPARSPAPGPCPRQAASGGGRLPIWRM